MRTAALPEPVALPEEALYEVVNGVRVELPPMGAESSGIASLLQIILGGYVRDHRLGRSVAETMFILDRASDLRRRPDVAFVPADRWPLDRPLPRGDWEVVPALAVEVTSPNDVFDDLERKVDEYISHGVREVWVIAPPTQRVYVYDNPGTGRIVTAPAELATPLVPGWRLPLAELFGVPAP